MGFTGAMTAPALGKGWEDAVAAKSPNTASVVVRMVEMLYVYMCVCGGLGVCYVCVEREIEEEVMKEGKRLLI